MSTFGPWFFDVETQNSAFVSVGHVTIDFTLPDANGNGASFAFTYTPDNGAPIGPIAMTPVRSQTDGNLYILSGALTPNLVIPETDPDAGTYVRAELFFNPEMGEHYGAFWGKIFQAAGGPGDTEVNVEASQNPPLPVELKRAALKATAMAKSY